MRGVGGDEAPENTGIAEAIVMPITTSTTAGDSHTSVNAMNDIPDFPLLHFGVTGPFQTCRPGRLPMPHKFVTVDVPQISVPDALVPRLDVRAH